MCKVCAVKVTCVVCEWLGYTHPCNYTERLCRLCVVIDGRVVTTLHREPPGGKQEAAAVVVGQRRLIAA